MNIFSLIFKIFTSFKKPVPAVVTPAPVQSQPTQPVPQNSLPLPALTPSERLYLIAKACLGRDASPNDLAPDEFGCMESVDDVYFMAFGHYINGSKTAATLSTSIGRKVMENSLHFRQSQIPNTGSIIISATGLGTNPAMPNGHVGIVGRYGILSNNSLTGKFDEHLTLKMWIDHYHVEGGYPVEYFECI